MHLFLPYILNDSQTIYSTIHFQTRPLRDANLCWLVRLVSFNDACNHSLRERILSKVGGGWEIKRGGGGGGGVFVTWSDLRVMRDTMIQKCNFC